MNVQEDTEAVTTSPSEKASPAIAPTERPRNIAYAHVWTAQREPIGVAVLMDELYGRGFLPGVTDIAGEQPPLTDAGLADARFTVDGEGLRVISQQSSKGRGCVVSIRTSSAADLPDDYLARRAVPRPRLCYTIEAGGPSHTDRNLCENIAEALMLMTDGVVEIGGLGTKGNRPTLHKSTWIGKLRTV